MANCDYLANTRDALARHIGYLPAWLAGIPAEGVSVEGKGRSHRWKTTTSRPGKDGVLRVHYLSRRRCGLKVKTEERMAVPWDEADLVAHVKVLLPEGKPVCLRERGITELPLVWLNGRLAPRGTSFTPAKVELRNTLWRARVKAAVQNGLGCSS